MKKTTGQAILEYAILVSALCAVFFLMASYTRRAAQAKLLIMQNRINEAAR